MYSIGEFSRITGLTVKTLRFYHEKGLIVPALVDSGSGYRRYDDRNVERARVILALRELEFSLEEIAEIVSSHDDESEIVELLERQKKRLRERLRKDRRLVATLDRIIRREKEAQSAMVESRPIVEEKRLGPQLVAGIRMQGRYSDCGKGFAKLGRALGRWIAGKPLCLYYDGEHREEDANFEPCFPVRPGAKAEGIDIRELPGGLFVSILHRGPYPELGRSYAPALRYAHERGYEVLLPTRELYLKGPGMIFKGNPRNYLTEILLPVRG